MEGRLGRRCWAEALCFGVPAPWDRWSFTGESGACTVRVRPKLLSTSAEGLRIAAVDGMGMTLLPSFVCGADLRRGELVSLFDRDTPGALVIHALYPDRRFLPARVRLFIDHLASSLGGDGNADPWDARAAEGEPASPSPPG
jgi:DNA-binding transcriptional LysR family regulator